MTELKPENNDSTWNTLVYQKVFADAGNDTLIGACTEKYMLDGSHSIGMGTLIYKWSPTVYLDKEYISNPLLTPTPSWSQKFTLIVTSTYNGLFKTDSDTAEVWVEVGDRPVADAGEDEWNVLDSVILDGSASVGMGPLTYLWWKYDAGNQVITLDSTVTTKIYGSGDYYLTITDRFGCPNTDEMHVGYLIEPFIAVDDTVETAQQEESVCIKVLRNDIIDSEDSYDLGLLMVISQPKHGTIIETPNDSCFTYVPDQYFIGTDTFTYIVSTEYNYSDEAIVIVRVLERPPIIPEGFSPNGDGINDFLIIENIEKYDQNSIIIFNRWGNIVYKKSKYSNSEPWDGIANRGIRIGQGPVPAGIYLYILDLGDDRVNQTVNGVTVNQRIVKGNIYVATDNRR
jgi:gliding motility-associated-like protein